MYRSTKRLGVFVDMFTCLISDDSVRHFRTRQGTVSTPNQAGLKDSSSHTWLDFSPTNKEFIFFLLPAKIANAFFYCVLKQENLNAHATASNKKVQVQRYAAYIEKKSCKIRVVFFLFKNN